MKKSIDIRRLIVTILFLLSGISMLAQDLVVLRNTKNPVSIGKQISIYEDKTSTLKIDQILAAPQNFPFIQHKKQIPNFQDTNSAIWVKFSVKKEEEGDFYLEIGAAFMDTVILHELNDDGTINVIQTGDAFSFYEREVEVSNYLFPLKLSRSETKTYYLKITSVQPLFFPIKVGTLKSFMEFTHDLDFVQGIYYGFMLLIFLYNLFLFFSTKEKIYLLYIIYVASITFFMAAIFGYFFEYLWPGMAWINQYVVMFSGLTIITATVFTRAFLETRKFFPRIDKSLPFFIGIGLIVILLLALDFKITALAIAQVTMLILSVYYLVIAVLVYKQGFKPAWYYLIAWGFLLIGFIIGVLEGIGVLPLSEYLNPMQVGSALEVMFLSFALGNKINIYRQETERAQEKALLIAKENEVLIKEQNLKLERDVQIRTEELTVVNEELRSINEALNDTLDTVKNQNNEIQIQKDQIVTQNNNLKEINREKDGLLGIVAHDLKAPLSKVKGLLYLVDLEGEVNEKQKETMNVIRKVIQEGDDLIRDILDVSSYELGQSEPKIEMFSFNQFLEVRISSFKQEASNKKIKLNTDFDLTIEKVFTDENLLARIIDNLLSNAIKFSDTEKEVWITTYSEKGFINISIKDEGPGISVTDQEKMFKKFQKLSALPTAGESSSGLGLSIVKALIDKLNGSIKVNSELKLGSEFVIRLPSNIN